MSDLRWSGWVVALAVAVGPALAWAQTAEPAEPSAAPGEEVMRPTERGLRLTPGMARAFSSMIFAQANDLDKLELSGEQRRQLAEATARRMMSIAHRDGRDGQAAMEYVIETMMGSMASGEEFKIRDYREFADKIQPLVRSGRDIFKGLAEDYRPILSAEQMKLFEKEMEKASRGMDRLEKRLEECRAGRFEEGKNPFEGLEEDEQELKAPEPKVDERVKRAQNQARWDVQWTTTWSWNSFLAGAAVMFKFDEVQKAKGQELLKQYEKKAEAIQTPEWTARVRRNRAQVYLQPQLKNVTVGPYAYRLEKEYKEAMRPLRELTGEFHKAVLGLATPEQRTAAMEEAQKVFEDYGLAAGEGDVGWLRGLIAVAE